MLKITKTFGLKSSGIRNPICYTWTLRKWNEMNRALGHLCAHIDYTGPEESPEDGAMNDMTLPSRHRIRILSKPWRSEAEHATSRSRRFHTILNHYEWAGKKHFVSLKLEGQKWMNECFFRPPLCAYRLNWAMRTSGGWWEEWDDTALHTQDSKFKPWWSEVELATSRSRRCPTILHLYEWERKKHFFFFF